MLRRHHQRHGYVVGGVVGGRRPAGRRPMFSTVCIPGEFVYPRRAGLFGTKSCVRAKRIHLYWRFGRGLHYYRVPVLYSRHRTEETERLANSQRQTILKLEEINQYIVQHLQSGIIIFNQEQQITLFNGAAAHFLNISATPQTLSNISEHVALAFVAWETDPHQNFGNLQLPGNSDIHIRFTPLSTQHETLYMLILEDSSIYQQRLQQAKLAPWEDSPPALPMKSATPSAPSATPDNCSPNVQHSMHKTSG